MQRTQARHAVLAADRFGNLPVVDVAFLRRTRAACEGDAQPDPEAQKLLQSLVPFFSMFIKYIKYTKFKELKLN